MVSGNAFKQLHRVNQAKNVLVNVLVNVLGIDAGSRRTISGDIRLAGTVHEVHCEVSLINRDERFDFGVL